MLIDQYFQQDNNKISFTRQQGSDFAKNIADDFNPLHDTESKRFCVPGDLLFSVVLSQYGVSQHMKFTFSGMVNDNSLLLLPEQSEHLAIKDEAGKDYLDIERSGKNSQNSELINNLTRQYVAFSGRTFPHILMPLLEEQGVMINPARPMVIYESMLIELEQLDNSDISLELDKDKTRLETNGKRGKICLAFTLKSGEQTVGRGEKHMVVSGLKPYEQEAANQLIEDYNQNKAAHSN